MNITMLRSTYCARNATCWWLYPASRMGKKQHVHDAAQR
ncbi:hypothetical protein NI35_1591 [Salmonella enterica subsp. enterica serovar Cerro]|uniref:Uncharacterized protein n=1 Tax=Salmonella enterica subsp. enterica serovar Montevideo str. S5-403 TaxID=913242 RepID=G5Q0R9_SALMO|nr:hypothetical protein SeGA_1431 [Salmonella enterica subsp. enterica serovar Gaminara str. A4-567]EHC80961.1 hypothetical protein LTSEMON_1401 [Salmonella enterica subsp. enterica serovar Montevideo str. S5-403]KMN26451.1 hypothetical protein NI35_1591 [Salmonella enterica subsp. enterica serovar Cerro]CEI42264.1 hypothetical protein SIN_01012 [Salmonella enterica subsp. enterica serovar Infantis]